ncbi:hypothetical protein HD554DRAFT_2039605 [Boletus coccyginus]|nr:hypothetical protein HD554DRAFT_2039605 [Boletus coccyginus]
MVTICADGDEIPPAVIYKGKSFSTSWHQGNELKAFVAHSEKGWTDRIIGQLLIKDFEHKMCTKHELLDQEPENDIEKTYQDELHRSYYQEDCLKTAVISMQAAGILNGIYYNWLHSQLAVQVEKEQNVKKRNGKLMGDGLPKYLTGDEFYQQVVDHEKATEEEELAKEECWKKNSECSEARTAWKDVEKGRLEQNRAQWQEYKAEVMAWEAECDLAKQEHQRPG